MSFWERRWAGLVAVALALALYSPTVVYRRVWLDDFWLWADDSPLRHVDGHVLHDVFFELHGRHVYGGEYLPVRDLVVAADMAVWGDNEHGPHVTQWLLFALVAWSLGTLLVRWGVGKRAAWLATLLWIAHPLCVQSVAWMSERKGMLAALFVLLCGHAWVRFRSGGSRGWLVASVLAAVCGVWCKAPAMFAVGVFGAWDLLLLKPGPRRWLQIVAVGVATALAAVPVVLVASRTSVIGTESGGPHVGRLAAALGVQGHYLAGLVLARQPSLSYPLQTDGPGALEIVLGVLAIAGSLVLVWRFRKDRFAMAALAWMWIWFVPISQLVAPVHILVADRYVFLWTIGGCLLAALALDRLEGIARTAATAALVGILAVCTIRAEGPWANSVDLFSAAIERNPRDWRMHQDLGVALVHDGVPEQALAAVEAGLAVLPDEVQLQIQRAGLLWQLDRRDESLAVAKQAALTNTSSAAAAYAKELLDSGRPVEALPWAEAAAKKHPELEAYQQTLAEVCVALGRWDCAEQAMITAIAIPGHQRADEVLLERVRAKLPASANSPSTAPASDHHGR